MGVWYGKRKDRPGWWVFIKHQGKRKAVRIGEGDAGKQAARQAAAIFKSRLALGQPLQASAQPPITFGEYAEPWLERIRQTRKPSTYTNYRMLFDRQILPAFRHLALADVTRERIKHLATAALAKGLSPKTVQNMARCLSSLLSDAVENNKIPANPALKPGKFLPKVSKRRAINPLTPEEAALLLTTTQEYAPRFYPLFLCAIHAGLRQGELLALEWGDIDFRSRFIEVRRSYTHGVMGTPKSGESRRVDMSLALTQALREVLTNRQLDATLKGEPSISPLVFCDEYGRLLHHNTVRKVFHRMLSKAEIRKVRFHDCRHTFASLLLQQGESPAYVKDQMGHSSITITVDHYGHLIPGGNRAAVDRLGESLKGVATDLPKATYKQPKDRNEAETVEEYGVDDGFRTRDLRIHNPAL